MTRPGVRALAPVVLLALLPALGCAKAKPAPPPVVAATPPTFTMSLVLAAAADVNPDDTGRPSPVVVRLYQLKTDTQFVQSEFGDLFDDDAKALGAELISRSEYVLGPNERRAIDLAVSTDARFVGAAVAYRDIRNAQWRAVVLPPRTQLTVDLQKARVVMSSTN